MLVYHSGDLLKSNENVICHQVNEDGYMGGGIALAIARKYPEVEEAYANFCENVDRTYLYGKCFLAKYDTKNKKYIANCFSQVDFTTDLNYLRKIFDKLLAYCKKNNLTIAVPYKYGCGIANGDWEEVSSIFEELSNKHNIEINVYKID